MVQLPGMPLPPPAVPDANYLISIYCDDSMPFADLKSTRFAALDQSGRWVVIECVDGSVIMVAYQPGMEVHSERVS